jgi:hypothetical protein
MRHLPTLILAAVALACTEAEPTSGPLLDAASGVEHASGDAARVYEVTIENLTTGQPFSPGIIVTHTAQQSLFAVGTEASEGLRLIAENGDPSMAVSMLAGAAGLADFQVVDAPIHRRGGPGPSTYTLTIEAKANANRLSGALMLICTNDGFVGLDGVKLPGGFQTVTHSAMAYDAGTEVNDEASASIVDPCFAIGPTGGDSDGNARTAEGSTVQPHPGIAGSADLDPAQHGWTYPVASVTIQRTQ